MTLPAVAEKVAEVALAGTVTAEDDKVSRELLSDRVTGTPPVGAAAERVTVQVATPLELSVAGAQARLVRMTAGVRAMEAVLVELP